MNSTLSVPAERQVLEQVREGAHNLVYVTPERLEKPETVELLARAKVSLFVVDEAHCVSRWGHDFRPAYLALRSAVQALGRPPILALTATATPEIVSDILEQLGMVRALVVNTGIDRHNLFLEVVRTPNDGLKRERLLALLKEEPGSGIVYAATVREVNALYTWLSEQGIPVGRYHGKLGLHERERAQRRFMDDELRVMVATNAFGLGVDKPNIRFVVHYQFPDSLESYYQEAGRAGRDGAPARAVLLYRLEDKRIQSYFLGGKYPRADESLRVMAAIGELVGASSGARVEVDQVSERASISQNRCKVILAQLERVGLLQRRRGVFSVQRGLANEEELAQILGEYEAKHAADRERIETMMHYAQSTDCRWHTLQTYFGVEAEKDCEHCDNCRDHPRERLLAADARTGQ